MSIKVASLVFVNILFLLISIPSGAAQKAYHSHYAGQEKRVIKSLSADDIKQLKHGKGWGLAKAAELNGMPGPVHILEMKKEISLAPTQERKIRALYNSMKSKAVPLGRKLIRLEKELNELFVSKKVSERSLKEKLDQIAKIRSQLRYVHLQAHLKTPSILTSHQVVNYNRLRGYGSGDPCRNIPKGHNAEMWKKHNDCK